MTMLGYLGKRRGVDRRFLFLLLRRIQIRGTQDKGMMKGKLESTP